MNTMTSSPILVVGGTGKTGRRVAERLAARGANVRVTSRTAATPFDWDRAATWPAVLDGVRAMYVAYHPDLALPNAHEQIGALCRAAVEVGVRRIVLLSGRGEDEVLPSEAAVRDAGAEWTILRAAWFAQNFSEGMLLPAVLSGTIAFAAGTVGEPFVDAADIADVAAVALTEPGHAGHIYDLTGPRLLTFADVASEIAEATGRAVRYQPISQAELQEALAAELPLDVATFMAGLIARVLDGHNAHVGDGVLRVLGRPARDFRAFARDAVRMGAWSA